MLNGLAAWHYPHRTLKENIAYFTEQGYEAISLLGFHFIDGIREDGEGLAEAMKQSGCIFTVHHKLPATHGAQDVDTFAAEMRDIGAWQAKHSLVTNLTFDVADDIRDNIAPYVQLTIDSVPNCIVGVEDFGLNPAERVQIEYLKGNPRFAFLIDIGHMFLRLRGQCPHADHVTLFRHTDDEGPENENPGYESFMTALKSKEFPICEIHLHNNDGLDDLHWFLNDGPLDIPMMAKVIRDFGFDGVLTIESAPGFKFECKGKDADDGIAKTFAYWKDCLAKA